MIRLLFATSIALLALLVASPAGAHAIGVSRGTYARHDATLDAELVFARGELAPLVPQLFSTPAGDGAIDPLALARAAVRDELARVVVAGIIAEAAGVRCPGTLVAATLTEQDGIAIAARYACAPGAGDITIEAPLFDALPHGHRHIARATSAPGAPPVDVVVFRGARTFTVGVASAPMPPARGAWAFVPMGIEHILTGYDHVVFLLGLALATTRPRRLLGVVSAFTVAHSITLALAALDVWAPSPRFVEPAIALSIAYVGIENLARRGDAHRGRITFLFGLVHGFGFSGALREIAMARADVPKALFGFNVGVELGQLTVLAVALPLFALLARLSPAHDRATRALNAAVVAAGLVWFVARVVAA